MQKSIILILTLVVSTIANDLFAQNINIPDTNFKNALIALKIDTNKDGEIQESEALAITTLNVSNRSINSLDGIEHFTNLSNLRCDNNQITQLNVNSLLQLNSIYCSNNFLTQLNISNLQQLHSLYLSGNQFTELEVSSLPQLKYLHLNNNKLNNLKINNLPNLSQISCNNNELTQLQFTDLPELFEIACSSNQLTKLDLNNLPKLIRIYCYNNQFTELELSNLPSFQHLHCQYNKLTGLKLVNLPQLNVIDCHNNNLTQLELSYLPQLQWLTCYNNKLTQLNLIKNNIDYLDCGSNPIEILYLKNGTNNLIKNWDEDEDSPRVFINIFKDVPYLKYICTDAGEVDELYELASDSGYYDVVINSDCNPAGDFYTLNGKVKVDFNNDGCDEEDTSYPNLKIKITSSTITGSVITGTNGYFSTDLRSGSYTFQPILDHPNYYSVNTVSTTHTLPDTISPSFCITPKGDFNDLAVSIIPVRAARPGFSDAQYKIVYKNQGTTTQSGTVTFSFDDDKMNVISSSPAADQSVFGLLTFNFSNLAPFESKSVLVTMRTNSPTDNPAVNVNDVLNFSANITAQTDVTPDDNTAILYQTVIGSYDPNDKTCLEGDIITPDMVGKRVNYLIRFENTGTAPAENVVVTDYIDTTVFDVNSLLVTSASHTCHTQISKGNKVQFIFSDIQLPFTEPDKHGYIAFSILLKDDLQIGDSIKNYADIYFDYNLPITTNEAISEVKNRVITSVKQKISEIQLSVYPNPSKGNFSVELKSNTTTPIVINVINIEGKVVFAKQYTAQQNLIPIQLEKLAKGTYLVQAQQENAIISRKVVVQ